MSHIHDHTPFWGTPSASVDWCEKNYEVCHFIAEFWNTITSSFIAILGAIGVYLCLRERLEPRFAVLHALIVVVGLGSVAFHGTLLLEYQLLDELPMIWGMLGFMYIYYTMDSPRKGREKDRKLAKILAVVGSVWGIGAPWIHYYAPIVFQGLFVLLVAFMVYKSFKYWGMCKNKTARRMFVFYHISIGCSALIWLVDKHACNVLHETLGHYWWHQYVGSFHGYWHCLMAVNVYLAPVFAAAMRAQMLNKRATIKWWCGLVPYVQQHRQLKSGVKSD